MLTFLFWNFNKRPLEGVVSALTYQHQVDVLILAECAIPAATMLLALAEANGQPFYFPRSNCRSISIYTRFSDASIQASHESDRITIRRLTLPARTGILLAGVPHAQQTVLV